MNLKLGKTPKRDDKRTFKMRSYLPTLPPVPAAIDWTGKVPIWGMMLNDTIGICTIAAAGHADMTWTSNAQTAEIIPSDSDILAAYKAITGYDPADPATDQGANELDVLNYWRKTGIAGRKIYAYAEVWIGNVDDIKAAVALFGGCYIGVQLPRSAMDAFQSNSVWDDVEDTDIVGGHALWIAAYDDAGVTLITWGRQQRATWAWLLKYIEEAYCPRI